MYCKFRKCEISEAGCVLRQHGKLTGNNQIPFDSHCRSGRCGQGKTVAARLGTSFIKNSRQTRGKITHE